MPRLPDNKQRILLGLSGLTGQAQSHFIDWTNAGTSSDVGSSTNYVTSLVLAYLETPM